MTAVQLKGELRCYCLLCSAPQSLNSAGGTVWEGGVLLAQYLRWMCCADLCLKHSQLRLLTVSQQESEVVFIFAARLRSVQSNTGAPDALRLGQVSPRCPAFLLHI